MGSRKRSIKPGDIVTHDRRRHRVLQVNGDRAALVETISGDNYASTYVPVSDLKLFKADEEPKDPPAGDEGPGTGEDDD